MRRTKRTIAIVAITLVSCSSQIVPAATPTLQTSTLRLYATTATAPLANDLAARYGQLYPSYRFDIVTGNYQAMVARLGEGEVVYLLTNHLQTDSPLWAAPIGQDGIIVIVHPDNPITMLTIEQLRSIYQGNTGNWREVGGLEAAITVISRENGSGTRAEFDQLVMGDRRTTSLAQIAPSSATVIASAARLPGSIGYVSMGYLDPSVRAIAIDGVTPTRAAVYENTYPLRTTLFFVGLAEPEMDYRAFIGWVQSPEGQVVVAWHYAPLVWP